MHAKVLYFLLAINILTNISANTIIAKKHGDFKKFSICELSEGKGTLKIDHYKNGKVIETTKRYNTFNDLKALAPLAINAIEKEALRWSVYQNDYYVINDKNILTNFYSFGFRMVQNYSKESDSLIQKIDQACDKLNDFKIIGNFEVKLDTGHNIFLDQMKIKRELSFPGDRPYISGEYSVPNSFTTNIKELNYIDNKFNFIIRVQEGAADYEAYFEATFSDNNTFTGNAYILPNKELLGTFEGTRL